MADDENISSAERKLREQMAQLKARLQKVEAARKVKEAKRRRSDDTRRKVLAGALVLQLMDQDDDKRTTFRALLDQFLIRPDDRKLFDLPEREATPQTETA
jgi:large subunit ribosomal protein L7/L12